MTPGNTTNRYFVLRHGHSQANGMGLVVSDLQRGKTGYGLTEQGRDQVCARVRAARDAGQLDAHVVVISSPFLRAVETTQLAVAILGVKRFAQDKRLRERFFGTLELGNDRVYPQVWAEDRLDPGHTQWDVESVVAVAARLQALRVDLDGRHRGATVLLVGHGDVASILLCHAMGEDLRRHREVGALNTAGLAEVKGA